MSFRSLALGFTFAVGLIACSSGDTSPPQVYAATVGEPEAVSLVHARICRQFRSQFFTLDFSE